MNRSMRRAAGRAAALLLAGAVASYSAIWLSATYLAPDPELGFTLLGETLEVLEVAPDSAAENLGLKPFDTIVAVEGVEIASPIALHDAVRELDTGESVRITVRMGALGRLSSFDIPVVAGEEHSGASWLGTALGALASCYPLILLCIALPVLFRRPDSPAAWLWCSGMLGVVVALLPLSYIDLPPHLRGTMFGFRALFGALGPALLFSYFAGFPSPAPIADRLPWLRDAAVGAAALGGMIAGLWSVSNPQIVLSSAGRNGALLMSLSLLAALVLSALALAGNFAQPATGKDARVLEWQVAGALAGLPLLLLLSAWSKLTGESITLLSHGTWTPPVFASLSFPAALAYVSCNDAPQALPDAARAIGRRLLAGRGLLTIWSLLGLLLVTPLADAMHGGGASLEAALSLGVGLAAVWGWVGWRMRPTWERAIERRLFAEIHRRRSELESAADAIDRAENVDEITRLLAERIRAAVQPSSIAIYLSDGDTLVARYGDVEEELGRIRFDERLPEASPRPRARTFGEISEIVDFGPDCLIPIRAGAAALQGLVALGPHASDAPYSKEDRQLLIETAHRAGVAIDRLSSGVSAADR